MNASLLRFPPTPRTLHPHPDHTTFNPLLTSSHTWLAGPATRVHFTDERHGNLTICQSTVGWPAYLPIHPVPPVHLRRSTRRPSNVNSEPFTSYWDLGMHALHSIPTDCSLSSARQSPCIPRSNATSIFTPNRSPPRCFLPRPVQSARYPAQCFAYKQVDFYTQMPASLRTPCNASRGIPRKSIGPLLQDCARRHGAHLLQGNLVLWKKSQLLHLRLVLCCGTYSQRRRPGKAAGCASS